MSDSRCVRRKAIGSGVVQEGLPVFRRHLVAGTRRAHRRHVSADASPGGQLLHLLRDRHAPTCESEKISFNQLNRKTGHRIKYAKVDADTGEEVANEDIVKGYKVDTDTFVEVTKEELENVALESTRTIEIGRIRRPQRDRSPLSHPALLSASGRQGRS